MKKLLTGIVFTAIASAQWVDVQTAYKPKDNVPTTRIEAGMTRNRFNTYGFLDFDGTMNKSYPRNAYLQTRASYELFKGVNAVAEMNVGTDFADTIRFGALYSPKLKDNFTVVKFYPAETTGKKGTQIDAYSVQYIGKFAPSVLVNYNVKPKTTYMELELEYKFSKHVTAYTQMRGFGTPTHPRLQPLFGLKFRR